MSRPGTWHRVLPAALAIGAAGAVLARTASPEGGFLPGVVILLVAIALVLRVRSRWAVAAAGLAALIVLVNVIGGGAVASGGAGSAGRWLQVVGSAVAVLVAVAALVRTRPPREQRSSRRLLRRPRLAVQLQVPLIMVLSAVCAEDLAAYDDTTGHPLRLLAGILVFAPLYGGPALLIREVARRSGRGWTTMLLLAAAFGLLEAGIVDQSLFSESYRNIPSWSDGLRPTYIGPLGVSAYYTHSFVLGHVIFSFCAPIALVEAMRPKTALSPWLGPWGTAVVVLLYLAAAALVLGDHLANESSHASVSEIVATFAVAGSLAVLAFTVKPPAARCLSEPASSPRRARTVFLAGFVGVTLYGVAPQTWLGVAMAAVAVAAGVALLVRESRRPGWGVTHTAALAAGAIVSRAVLAFSYYPVIGDISAARKYVHNVAMLLVAAGISAYAIKRARGAGADDWPLSSARRA